MPAYLGIKMMFNLERIKPCFIMDIYQHFIDTGFDFLGGFRFNKLKKIKYETTIEEISNWNQYRLEKRISLGFPKEVYDEDDNFNNEYRQILFKHEGYSELRGYWDDWSKKPQFGFIVPEDDVLLYKNGVWYKQKMLEPFIKIAQNLWNDGLVDIIQTTLEEDDPLFSFSDVSNGENISFRSFAILQKSMYDKFAKDYFSKAQVSQLKNNGIYIEQTDRMI